MMTNVSPSGNHGYSPSGEPVYVGGNGSKVHEQSVMLPRRHGMASNSGPPCIMCRNRPQREIDYFCSKACKDHSSEKVPRGKISDHTGYEYQ
ncbi:hypothetical protein K443DRAFT_364991 [Laccaria amethystina LaAM-08-1]|uniref:Uncharacterized protein n=1 Tax=Laccaria amethystina LaAM-08-1 TaxID=1095629 RepID=A0A0C9WZ52_9AGAR|nr:hypothetical protein K443DRAFT_364991 [Laccaria amethystina LaAM-08-1]